MSGTGKSTLIANLSARGYKAVDVDAPGWSEYVTVSAEPGDPRGGRDWVWREDRVQKLLSAEDSDMLFLSGCASNQVGFYEQFDHIVLLSAPVPLMVERLATRTNNAYGKHPDELAQVLYYQKTVEPRLRTVATSELDTSAPVADLITALLALVGQTPSD